MTSTSFIKKIFIPLLLILSVVIIYYAIKPTNAIINLTENEKNEYAKNDSLKLLSLNFLIENSVDKYSIGIFNLKKSDFKNINKKYLFQNIELSILNSKERLNQGVFSTQQFLNYILPYRIRNENTENWRNLAYNKYKSFYNEDILEHSKNINDELKKIFNYTGRSKANRKLSDLLVDCYGGCFEMSELAAFTMRANGIPVAIDFTKWSNIRGRHQWNSLITKNINIPFMGIESDPVFNFNLDVVTADFKKFAKVYRKSFLKYEKSNTEYNPKKLISDINYIDVTKEYCANCNDIIIELPNENINDDLFYLCVYEVNKWIPVDFAYVKNNTIKFNDVCPNNVFVLKKRVNKKLEYFKTPFTFNNLGEVSFTKPSNIIFEDIELKYYNSNHRELIKQYAIEMKQSEFAIMKDLILKNNVTGVVKNNIAYNLYLWENKWINIGKETALNGSIIFKNISKNALFKLEGTLDSKSVNNRCFTIDNDNNQIWW